MSVSVNKVETTWPFRIWQQKSPSATSSVSCLEQWQVQSDPAVQEGYPSVKVFATMLWSHHSEQSTSSNDHNIWCPDGGLVFICWNDLMVSYIWSSFIYNRKWKEIESFLKAVFCSNWYSSNASLCSDNFLNGIGQDFHWLKFHWCSCTQIENVLLPIFKTHC